MIFNPQTELRHIIVIILVSLVFGMLIDAVAWTLVVSLSGYTLWNLRQLSRLYEWINDPNPIDPPASHGLWGAVFDDIYKLQRQQFKYRARLKKVIKRFRDSTYALQDGFVMLDSQGNIDWWNPAAEQLLGLRSPTDTNQLITNLIRDPRFKHYFHSENYKKPLSLSSPINPASQLEFQITLFGKRDHLMIVRNITEVKRLDKIRTDFVANVSHELRTPLTVIDGYLETLSDNTDISNPRLQQAMQHMVQQCRRMKALIEDLLLLSRLEAKGSGTNKPVSIKMLTEQVQKDLKSKLEERENTVTLTFASEQQVLGQQAELYSLICNLINNASKYSQKGSHIKVTWINNKNGATLSIEDNGPGISATDLPRLTERFYRADKGRSQKVVGTGLGLAIVKHILINHDAKLDIKSTLGKGSTFMCHFPLQRLHMEQQSTAI